MPRLSILSAFLALVSAATVFGQEKAPPEEQDDPVSKSRVHLAPDFGGHSATPQHLLFTPDGKLLISVADDRTVQVWDVQTRERLRVIHLPRGAGSSGSQPDDPNRFITLSEPGLGLRAAKTPLVVDRKGERVSFCTEVNNDKGEPVRTTFVFGLKTGETQALQGAGPRDFSRDGKFLALGARRDVQLVDLTKGKPLQTATILPPGATNVVEHLTFSPDGKTLAVVAQDANLYLLEADTFKLKNTWTVAGKDKLGSVTWADDQTVVCRSSSAVKTLLVVDINTGTVKQSHPAAVLFDQLPPKVKNQGVLELQAIPGTKKMFVRLKANDSSDTGVSASFLLDWETGKANKAFVLSSPMWTSASAVAPDLSVAAHGDGGRINAIALYDPRTAEVPKEWADSRLKCTVLGADGWDHSIRWRSDGKGIVWEQLGSRSRAKRSYAELDLTALAFRSLKEEEFVNYGKEDATLAGGDKLPRDNKWPKFLYERGILSELEGLTLKVNGGDLEVTGGSKPVKWHISGVSFWNCTLVAGGRVITHRFGFNKLQVFDSGTGKEVCKARLTQSAIQAIAVSPRPAGRYLLVGSADQTLTVHNPTTNEVLLTVFPSGPDWIAWTPQGYYAATPGGERLMGWYVDNGPDKLASFYPADRFRKTFYRPDVIKRVLEKGSVEEALQAANDALKKEGVAVKEGVARVEKSLPPTVTLSVVDTSQLPKVKFKTMARAGATEQPLVELRLFADGRPLADQNASLPLKEVGDNEHEWTVELPPGQHRVVALARSADASGMSNQVDVNSSPVTERPVLHVLAIGINKYNADGLNLNCAEKDATDLADTLGERCGGKLALFGEVRPKKLLNEDATHKNILDELGKLKAKVKDGDLVIVFFAGHGAKEKDQFYLLPHDTDLNDLAKSALSGKELRDKLKEIPCQVLLIMDACHASGFGAKGKLALNKLKPATDDATRMLTEDDIGVVVMCAAMGNETAEERKGNGLFTEYLIKALKADTEVPFNKFNHRQYIHHLQSYVFDKVAEESGEKQHPFLHQPWAVESFALRIVPMK